MPSDRDRRLLDLLDEGLTVEPRERAQWLDEVCADDLDLRQELQALLSKESDAEFLFRANATEPAVSLPTQHSVELATGPLARGSQLGDFLIEDQIGAGGMGVVYRAEQSSLKRTVAVKVLPDYLRHSPSARARFRREIEASARLHHMNIVSVHATGEEFGRLFYAMELIDGPPLNQILEHFRAHPIPELQSATPADMGREVDEATVPMTNPPDWAIKSLAGGQQLDGVVTDTTSQDFIGRPDRDYFDRVATALAEVAGALAYAHQHGIVHRDIKPSNLLMSLDGRLHISDFGLARSAQEPNLTRTGECVGTPFYMAPEQVSAGEQPIDGRVDVYGLGATLYELLTLRPPFVADSRDRVLAKITNTEPIPPRRLNKRVPHDLQTICLKALEKAPRDRYQTAAEMAGDLRLYVSRFAISAKRSGPIGQAIKWAQRHRGLSTGIVIACVLAATAMFFAYRAHSLNSRWNIARQQQVFETALMASLEGKLDDAKSAVDDARRLGAPPERIHLLEGQVDLQAGQFKSAHEHFQKAAELLPQSVAAQSLLAYSCLRQQLFDQGEKIVNRLDELPMITLEDYLYKARAEAFFNMELAAATLNQAVDRDKTSLVARLIRAEVQTKRAMDSADPEIAKTALDDYEIAYELLGSTPLVSNGHMTALLVACSAYETHDMSEQAEVARKRAAKVADDLARLNTARAHRTRALYFDYIGETELAISEWREIQESTVLFLTVTLFREGRFDEAIAACDDFVKRGKGERMMDFIRALLLSATSQSPEILRKTFPLRDGNPLSPIHELLTVYTRACLTGELKLARAEAGRLKRRDLPKFLQAWYGSIESFAAGEISAEQLIEIAGPSRRRQCECYFYLGVTKLAEGDRKAALRHFHASESVQIFNFYEHHLSSALAAQLVRDPNWPVWINPSE